MIASLISICRPVAMSVLHISGILYGISLNPPVPKRPLLHLVLEILYQDRFFLKSSQVLHWFQMLLDVFVSKTTCHHTSDLGRSLSYSPTVSGLFFYVLPASLSIQSCSLMSFMEIPSIFILRADKKSACCFTWKSQHLYEFYWNCISCSRNGSTVSWPRGTPRHTQLDKFLLFTFVLPVGIF